MRPPQWPVPVISKCELCIGLSGRDLLSIQSLVSRVSLQFGFTVMRVTNTGSSEKKPGHKNRKRTIAIALEGVDGACSERDRKTMNNLLTDQGR